MTGLCCSGISITPNLEHHRAYTDERRWSLTSRRRRRSLKSEGGLTSALIEGNPTPRRVIASSLARLDLPGATGSRGAPASRRGHSDTGCGCFASVSAIAPRTRRRARASAPTTSRSPHRRGPHARRRSCRNPGGSGGRGVSPTTIEGAISAAHRSSRASSIAGAPAADPATNAGANSAIVARGMAFGVRVGSPTARIIRSTRRAACTPLAAIAKTASLPHDLPGPRARRRIAAPFGAPRSTTTSRSDAQPHDVEKTNRHRPGGSHGPLSPPPARQLARRRSARARGSPRPSAGDDPQDLAPVPGRHHRAGGLPRPARAQVRAGRREADQRRAQVRHLPERVAGEG